ncbi:glycoside hydrolase family 3 C-terminal domain-containing protein [Planomonospora venezuelensis]|uniref:Exo-alpha-(1->6)-L-arabinopyranosidase n=1 Tax=Planomonospora venezuelensis TaxID=1999 RepID=A0A841D1R7_PLAVE|nr:glycoside hydrolase family 3 C-terminal domain-containing protein [Planomonospora venezuelensis]MBB5962444.1 beta-glucosidase [Planomonospora venezuelensis]GIN00826.1 glycosyl hydrolase [Planomonospora venezuelensis]
MTQNGREASTAGPVPEEVSGLGLEEKASLTSGSGTWNTTAVPGTVRALTLSDGPHGMRRQPESTGDALGIHNSLPATCFPPAVALGSSWDPELARRVGAALGREASALGVDVVLGPGVNIKRSPLCGRNFEYFSEDPHLTGVMGAAVVAGIQSLGVGACVKHFAVNNQETDRMRVSAEVDEQTLREIYLPAFEHIVREARPYTVMCSYNRINGVYASQNRWLLTDLLRGEWGFDGLVTSDWGAVNDRVAALEAGLDLEMPPTGTDGEIVEAVRSGRLPEAVLDRAAGRLLALARRTGGRERFDGWDADAHHEIAREAARASAVLLKNDGVQDEGPVLPLDLAAHPRVAVLGELARTPRYQGGGSSHVVPTRLDSAWDALGRAIGQAVGQDAAPTFAAGYRLDGEADAELEREAVAAAAEAGTALVFLGLPDAAESEGYDRTTIDLPAVQVALLRRVAEVCPRVVVVLSNGGVVSVAGWQDSASAILEGWLLGQAGGSALADLLLGTHSPSGRLTETIPNRLADVPSHLHFPGADGHVVYGEGRYVGYRHHDTLGTDVAYPFGHGLTYSRFEYSDLDARATGDNEWSVEVTVTNTGGRFAHEVVQLYVAFEEERPSRPRHELRGFAKVGLEPGAGRRVRFTLTGRDVAQWSVSRKDWKIDPGSFTVEVGASSRDIRLRAGLTTPGDGYTAPLSGMSTLGEWLAHPSGGAALRKVLGDAPALAALDQVDPALLGMALGFPLIKFSTFGIGLTPEVVDRLVATARELGSAAAAEGLGSATTAEGLGSGGAR